MSACSANAVRRIRKVRSTGHVMYVSCKKAYRACLRAVPKSSSAPGCASRARLLGQRAKWCRGPYHRAWSTPGGPSPLGPRHLRGDPVGRGAMLRRHTPGTPHCGAADRDRAVLRTAERRKRATYPELAQGGAQQLCVLGCEVGGRWNAEAASVVRRLVRLRACRAPHLCARLPASPARRWWSALSVACQQAVGSTALGRARAVQPADPG